MKAVRSRFRKRWLFLPALLVALVWIPIRVSNAKSYMEKQMTRLAAEGYPGYEISRCDYLSLSDYAHFPCITVQARRKEAAAHDYGDGFHYIEVDFPWLPFTTPEHRI
jgi:hypothetical protein